MCTKKNEFYILSLLFVYLFNKTIVTNANFKIKGVLCLFRVVKCLFLPIPLKKQGFTKWQNLIKYFYPNYFKASFLPPYHLHHLSYSSKYENYSSYPSNRPGRSRARKEEAGTRAEETNTEEAQVPRQRHGDVGRGGL